MGYKIGPQTDQVLPNVSRSVFWRSRKTLKHAETPSGLDLRSFHVLCCFAFSNFSVTAVNKYMIFLIFCGSTKYIKKHQAYRPFEIQWAPKWDPKSTKWRQKCFKISIGQKWHPKRQTTHRPPLICAIFFGSDILMHFGRALTHFW